MNNYLRSDNPMQTVTVVAHGGPLYQWIGATPLQPKAFDKIHTVGVTATLSTVSDHIHTGFSFTLFNLGNLSFIGLKIRSV